MELGHPSIELANPYPGVVIVDNFIKNPMEHREFALGLQYAHKGSYGLRSKESYPYPEYKTSFERLLGRPINRWYTGVNGCYQWCNKHQDIVYHVDDQDYAGVLYLTPDAPHSSGTSLWKSKNSGERFMREDVTSSLTFGEDGEHLRDPTQWELVDKVGNVFNRLVLWHGKFIHSASSYFGEDVTDSRLFQVFFFHVEA
jgi:hypothetical protein|tara:strand:+ start:2125 stop:2721 length:597 start_codon:yes stop_codon:yes gene_type:complete